MVTFMKIKTKVIIFLYAFLAALSPINNNLYAGGPSTSIKEYVPYSSFAPSVQDTLKSAGFNPEKDAVVKTQTKDSNGTIKWVNHIEKNSLSNYIKLPQTTSNPNPAIASSSVKASKPVSSNDRQAAIQKASQIKKAQTSGDAAGKSNFKSDGSDFTSTSVAKTGKANSKNSFYAPFSKNSSTPCVLGDSNSDFDPTASPISLSDEEITTAMEHADNMDQFRQDMNDLGLMNKAISSKELMNEYSKNTYTKTDGTTLTILPTIESINKVLNDPEAKGALSESAIAKLEKKLEELKAAEEAKKNGGSGSSGGSSGGGTPSAGSAGSNGYSN